MIRLRLLGLLLAAVAPALARAEDPRPLKGLLITGGCCHDYERQTLILTEGLSQRMNITWDVVQGGDGRQEMLEVYSRADWSAGYDLVVHNECYGQVDDVDFVHRIVAGHGRTGVAAVVIHCSMHSYRAAQTDAWRKFLGVTSRRHEKGGRRLDVTATRPDHPIMKGFPAQWKTPNGELYVIENAWPNCTPLASAFGEDTGQNHICIWTNTYEQARVFGTTLGHHNETMMSEVWLDTVARGALWACGKLTDQGEPAAGYGGSGKAPFSFQKAASNAGEPTLAPPPPATLRAGAAAVDITPLDFPVIINGGMSQRTADKVSDRLHARSLVLDDGDTRIALVVIDSCMMPRELLDEAKRMAAQATGIPESRILMSATHTHSAPASMGCLGTERDDAYAGFVAPQLAKAVQQANDRLQPARIGFAFGRDEKNVACRRWEMKEGVAPTNPFGGGANDRAQMHPGHNNPNAIRATGTPDPEIPVLALQTSEGAPLALLAAYSLHYVGTVQPVSADYFGSFCRHIAEMIGQGRPPQSFFPALANATSGDMWLMDYTEKERRQYDHETVAKEVAAAALEAYRTITYQDRVDIEMLETELELNVRMPTAEEVQRAREFVATFADRPPKTIPEVYARETLLLHEMPPTRRLKLQAIRLGDLAIVAIPNEVFSDTGLAIKRDSPFEKTFTIELANGAEGYIPPPDQHPLGGYTTWRARTSCLEADAEPKIRARLQQMLQQLKDGQ